MSLLCKHHDLDGADLIRLFALSAERKVKPTPKPIPEPKGHGIVEKLILASIGLGAAYFAVIVLVAVVRGWLR